MSDSRFLLALLCALLVGTGCATQLEKLREQDALTCAAVGGVTGAVAGMIIANPRHSDDSSEDYAIGAGVGGAIGAAAGALLCTDPGGVPPTVRATANPASGEAPLSVDLRAVGKDDGGVVEYAWDLGDGTRASGSRVSHTYRAPGSYVARVTVTDNSGRTAAAEAKVSVAQAPAPEPPPAVPTRRIVLRGVHFDFDKAEVRPEGGVILAAGAEALRGNRDVLVEVAGHTDSIGPEAYNQQLSERRARAVADYLETQGIDRARLRVVGYGEARPVASNDTEEGRAQNRRVELTIR
jgi:OOP family OmpA-OmpF porin